MNPQNSLQQALERLTEAIERLAPAPAPAPDLSTHAAYIWQPEPNGMAHFAAVETVKHIPLHLLLGIDQQKARLLANTRQFAHGFAANNALLWGARGTGKSALIKAVHGELAPATGLKLIEIHRGDIATLPACLSYCRTQNSRFLLFCDDLSFEADESAYKSLKAVLEGGLEGRPDNVLFYATSNRRHLMPRDMIENERSTAIQPAEVVEEKVSLSDRFGLWIGFHALSQADYLAIVEAYANHFALDIAPEIRDAEAIAWAATRGARSGRVAWQYIQDLAGRLGRSLDTL